MLNAFPSYISNFPLYIHVYCYSCRAFSYIIPILLCKCPTYSDDRGSKFLCAHKKRIAFPLYSVKVNVQRTNQWIFIIAPAYHINAGTVHAHGL